jgi:hypothetical protein
MTHFNKYLFVTAYILLKSQADLNFSRMIAFLLPQIYFPSTRLHSESKFVRSHNLQTLQLFYKTDQ